MKKHLAQMCGGAIIVAIVWPFLHAYGPVIEGRLAPVIANVELKTYKGRSANIKISGSARKRRNCTFTRLEWYYTNGSTSVLVPVEFLEGNKIRGAGYFDFGPWRIRLTRDQIKTQTYAYAYHQCHPLWETRTAFWG